MYAGHQFGMLGILLIVLQQKLASFLIQSGLWKGLYQQTSAAEIVLGRCNTFIGL